MNLLKLDVIFKSVSKRDAGEFINDKGEKLSYEEAYVIKFDENVNGDIKDRRLKFPVTNKNLHHKLTEISPYTRIALICDVQLYTSNAKLLPIDIEG